jgi:hypothetical protein
VDSEVMVMAKKHTDALPEGGGGASDPLLAAVIDKLPAQGPWLQPDRDAWLKMLTLALDVAYGLGTAAPS